MNIILYYLLLIIYLLIAQSKDLGLIDESSIIDYKVNDGLYVYKKIVNPHPYKFTINPGEHFCGQDKGKNVYLLIVVNSNPYKFDFRSSLRDTWAKRSIFPDVRVLFLMGQPTDLSLNKRLLLEQNLYRDILQGDFYDSYRNLTLKGIMSLKWVNQYCSNIKYFVKTDDDVIIDVFLLKNRLKNLENFNEIPKKSILCSHFLDRTMPVIRDPTNKWYVSKKEYEAENEYCPGVGYIFTSDLIKPMLNVSQYVKFVWIDDFFMTGVLGSTSNVKYINLEGLYCTLVYDPYTVLFKFSLDSNYKRLFIHIKDVGIRNLIWFYIVERQLDLYLYKNQFKSIGIQEFGVFDDYYWIHQA